LPDGIGIFKPKFPLWVNFDDWEMLVYVFYGHLGYFMDIWYILLPFGIFYGHLACCTAI
jgi:hypothetical protein